MGPLVGQQILVTRPGEAGHTLSAMLEGLGARVRHLPAIAVETLPIPENIRTLATGCDHVLLSSVHALPTLKAIESMLDSFTVLAAGPQTAAAAREVGWKVSMTAPEGGLESLVDALDQLDLAGTKVLWPTSSRARSELLQPLVERGVELRTFTAYGNTNPLEGQSVDLSSSTAVVFASPSAVTNLESTQAQDELTAARSSLHALAIGKTTATALKDRGWAMIDVAARPSNEGLLAAALEFLSGDRS